MRNRFIPVFSFTHVGASYDPHFIQPCNWRLGRFGGSAGGTARRICVLSGATLPPIARLTLSHRYSPNPCASCIAKNARSAPDRFTAAVACRGGVKEAQLQRDTISLGKRASINSCA